MHSLQDWFGIKACSEFNDKPLVVWIPPRDIIFFSFWDILLLSRAFAHTSLPPPCLSLLANLCPTPPTQLYSCANPKAWKNSCWLSNFLFIDIHLLFFMFPAVTTGRNSNFQEEPLKNVTLAGLCSGGCWIPIALAWHFTGCLWLKLCKKLLLLVYRHCLKNN